MATARANHTATTLTNGKILVVGGIELGVSGPAFASSELYDPATNAWTPTGPLANGRHSHSAVSLPNGKVLVVGGRTASNLVVATAELYDPGAGTWSLAAPLSLPRADVLALLLANGKVMVAGGSTAPTPNFPYGTPESAVELYDPATNT